MEPGPRTQQSARVSDEFEFAASRKTRVHLPRSDLGEAFAAAIQENPSAKLKALEIALKARRAGLVGQRASKEQALREKLLDIPP